MRGLIIIAAVAITASGAALAQDLGSVMQGEELAQNVCAECHAVAPGAIRSPNGHAPTFASIAQTPGMTPMAIRVWLRSAHKEMPNIMLSPDEVDNVIAYLATLKNDASGR